jgi:ABC-type lipopolysaccharide export system ATPase subunit
MTESPSRTVSAGAGLVVDKVGKRFGDRQVVKNVSLRLARGEVAGLLPLTLGS